MKPSHHGLSGLFLLLDEPQQSWCTLIYSEHRELFERVQGSSHNHQAWPGGYEDHVCEVMNIACILYDALSAARPLTFTLNDALFVLFLHDIEKPWKYEIGEDGALRIKEHLRDKMAQRAFRDEVLRRYGIVLTPDQANALTYVEGEHADYKTSERVMNPLAAFCHMCDVASARIWHDHPLATDDPWHGAKRCNPET